MPRFTFQVNLGIQVIGNFNFQYLKIKLCGVYP